MSCQACYMIVLFPTLVPISTCVYVHIVMFVFLRFGLGQAIVPLPLRRRVLSKTKPQTKPGGKMITVYLEAYARLTPFTCLRLPDILSDSVFLELLSLAPGGVVRRVAAGGNPRKPRRRPRTAGIAWRTYAWSRRRMGSCQPRASVEVAQPQVYLGYHDLTVVDGRHTSSGNAALNHAHSCRPRNGIFPIMCLGHSTVAERLDETRSGSRLPLRV